MTSRGRNMTRAAPRRSPPAPALAARSAGLLLAVNAVFDPGFWQLQWRDGLSTGA